MPIDLLLFGQFEIKYEWRKKMSKQLQWNAYQYDATLTVHQVALFFVAFTFSFIS